MQCSEDVRYALLRSAALDALASIFKGPVLAEQTAQAHACIKRLLDNEKNAAVAAKAATLSAVLLK